MAKVVQIHKYFKKHAHIKRGFWLHKKKNNTGKGPLWHFFIIQHFYGFIFVFVERLKL